MRERADEVILGTMLLMQASGAPQCLIGIEDNKSKPSPPCKRKSPSRLRRTHAAGGDSTLYPLAGKAAD